MDFGVLFRSKGSEFVSPDTPDRLKADSNTGRGGGLVYRLQPESGREELLTSGEISAVERRTALAP